MKFPDLDIPGIPLPETPKPPKPENKKAGLVVQDYVGMSHDGTDFSIKNSGTTGQVLVSNGGGQLGWRDIKPALHPAVERLLEEEGLRAVGTEDFDNIIVCQDYSGGYFRVETVALSAMAFKRDRQKRDEEMMRFKPPQASWIVKVNQEEWLRMYNKALEKSMQGTLSDLKVLTAQAKKRD